MTITYMILMIYFVTVGGFALYLWLRDAAYRKGWDDAMITEMENEFGS